MSELPEQTRTAATIWRYLNSQNAIRDAVLKLPDFERLEKEHARFTYASFLSDRSLKVRGYKIVTERIQYTYEIELFHFGRDVIVVCARKEIAEAIRSAYFSALALVSLEIDIEKLTKEHSENVRRLYVRLENNRHLHALSFYGKDILGSHLFREMGTATFLSVTLIGAFGCANDSLISFNVEGTFSADIVLTEKQKTEVVKKILMNYERAHG